MYAAKLLERSWAGKMTPVEKAYAAEHARWFQVGQAKAAAMRLRKVAGQTPPGGALELPNSLTGEPTDAEGVMRVIPPADTARVIDYAFVPDVPVPGAADAPDDIGGGEDGN